MLKNWNLAEKLLLLSPIIVLLLGIYFQNDIFTILASVCGILTAVFLARGSVVGQFLGVVLTVLYSLVSYQNKFYGEMIIYLLMMLPMYIYGIVEWTRHKNEKTQSVEVNQISKKEWLSISIIALVLFILFYFILKSLNTNLLFISTLSVVDNIFAIYLLVRRSKYGFASYLVNDLILIGLWGGETS